MGLEGKPCVLLYSFCTAISPQLLVAYCMVGDLE